MGLVGCLADGSMCRVEQDEIMEKLDWQMIEISLFCGEGKSAVDSFSGVLKGKKKPLPFPFMCRAFCLRGQPLLQYSGEENSKVSKPNNSSQGKIHPTNQVNSPREQKVSKQKLRPSGGPGGRTNK